MSQVNITGGAILAVVGIGVGFYAVSRIGNAVAAAGNAVNPTSSSNLVNRMAEAIYGGGADGQGNIGSDIWTLINGREGVRP